MSATERVVLNMEIERLRNVIADMQQREKQIQLSAMKEGMRRAANIIRKDIESAGCGEINETSCEFCIGKNNSMLDILSAVEQLTEKDL